MWYSIYIVSSGPNRTSLDNISLKIVDQNNNLVDFRGEVITVRLHLKKC